MLEEATKETIAKSRAKVLFGIPCSDPAIRLVKVVPPTKALLAACKKAFGLEPAVMGSDFEEIDTTFRNAAADAFKRVSKMHATLVCMVAMWRTLNVSDGVSEKIQPFAQRHWQ